MTTAMDPFDPPGRVVAPGHFYAAPARHGLGLYCRVDLEPGDRWWLYDFADRDYVHETLTWHDYQHLNPDRRATIHTLGFLDSVAGVIVLCAEPFCRVNHGGAGVNSASDADGHSYAVRPIRAGEEITISYEYETLRSLVWKFPEFALQIHINDINNDEYMMTRAGDHAAARAFLNGL
jgi:hypothetical protein